MAFYDLVDRVVALLQSPGSPAAPGEAVPQDARSGDDTRSAQPADLLRGVARFTQDLVAVLSDGGRPLRGYRVDSLEMERRGDGQRLAVREGHQRAAVLHLLARQRLVHRPHDAERHPDVPDSSSDGRWNQATVTAHCGRGSGRTTIASTSRVGRKGVVAAQATSVTGDARI